MYKEQTIKFYNQTGFNAIDIPDSPKMLEEKFTPYKVINNANIIQNEFLAYIIVDDFTPEEARKIDYVIVENPTPTIRNVSCYTIDNFEFLADGTCKFNLYLDAYNTLGGFNMDSGNQILGGSAKRMSVSVDEDNANFFTLEEPFIPSQKYYTEYRTLTPEPTEANEQVPLIEVLTIPPQVVGSIVKEGGTDFGKVNILIDAILAFQPMTYLGAKIGEYVERQKIDTESGTVESANYNTMIIPQMRKLKNTIVKLRNADNEATTIETNSRYFWALLTSNTAEVDGKTVESDLITDMRAAGRDNDIINFWEVPSEYIKSTKPNRDTEIEEITYKLDQEKNYGGFNEIESNVIKGNIIFTPFTSYNNKARYKQSVEVKVYCPASGEQINKELYEVIKEGILPNTQAFTIPTTIMADIRPQGTPIFIFDYYNQTLQTKQFSEFVKGAQWRNIPLAASGISGENVMRTENDAERNYGFIDAAVKAIVGLGQIAVGAGMTIASAGTSSAMSAGLVGSGISTALGGISQAFNTQSRYREQENLLNQKSVNASSRIQLGNSSFIRDIRKNYFIALFTTYSQEDMIAYDTFLTRFGYNVGNRVIKQTDFFSRPAFNFMQINDITIESVLGDINLIDLTKKQLKQGVRIWHKKPNFNDMLAGGNR